MRYATADAFRAALDARLKRRAADSGMTLSRLRKYVAFERLLARLLIVAPERYVLKGGYALDIRFGDRARSTQDLDLAVAVTDEEVIRDLASAGVVDIADFFTFQFSRSNDLDRLEEATAVRFSIEASLAGKTFERFRLDVGVEGLGTSKPERLIGGDLLTFADIPAMEFPVVPIAQHIAEKIHAYTKVYASGQGSSRVKDLIDLVLIAELMNITAIDLTNALTATFSVRGTNTIPLQFPRPPADWEVTFRRDAREVGIDPDIQSGWQAASAFLNPVLEGEVATGATWSPAERRWVVS